MIVLAYIFLILAGAFLLYKAFQTEDRRYIYLAVAFYVIFPVVITIQLPIDISPETQQLYDAIESLPDSSKVMLTFDYYASTLAEAEPLIISVIASIKRSACRSPSRIRRAARQIPLYRRQASARSSGDR